jgi:hypothetical protein
MTDKKVKRSGVAETLKEMEETPKGIWAPFVMGILTKTPETVNILEIFRMTREMYLTQKETAREQMKLRYCLYSILSIMIITSAILLVVFYSVLSMTSIGLSFLGPLITGILGLIVVLFSGRK